MLRAKTANNNNLVGFLSKKIQISDTNTPINDIKYCLLPLTPSSLHEPEH